MTETQVQLQPDPRQEQPVMADFSAAYRLHGRALYGTALRMLRRPEDAEDAVQEAFLAYYRRQPSLAATRLGAWLHRVLVNHCIDQLRRSQRWQQTAVTETVSVAAARQDGPGFDIARAVAELPQRARQVFLLHDVEGFTHQELAGLLGLREGTSKSQLSRARRLLREQMSRKVKR